LGVELVDSKCESTVHDVRAPITIGFSVVPAVGFSVVAVVVAAVARGSSVACRADRSLPAPLRAASLFNFLRYLLLAPVFAVLFAVGCAVGSAVVFAAVGFAVAAVSFAAVGFAVAAVSIVRRLRSRVRRFRSG
jgi:hypothetical protein